MLARELERLLAARGWLHGEDADELEWSLPLADGVVIELDVFEDEDGTIAADVVAGHAHAQRWLMARGVRVSVYLSGELAEVAGRDEPLAWAGPDLVACAAEVAALADDAVARLRERAGTRAAYLEALAQDPERAEWIGAIAAAMDAEGEPPPPEQAARVSLQEVYERERARRDAVDAMRARDLPDADARTAALEAELAARGLEETPLWIRTRAEDTRGSWRGLAKDVVGVVRRIRDGECPEVPMSAGPWRTVTLEPAADPALAAAYDGANMRIGGVATVAVSLTPDGAVVLDDGGTVIGRIDPPGPATVTPTQLRLARLASGFFAEAGVPEAAA